MTFSTSENPVNTTGRPPLDRTALLQLLQSYPRHGGGSLIQFNEREAARTLGWSRATVGRALDQLQSQGLVDRYRLAGRGGVVLRIADSEEEIEQFLEGLDPETSPAVPTAPELFQIARAVDASAFAEKNLRHAIDAARAANVSWGRIGMVLGITRQGAQKRFGSSREIDEDIT